ncbi:MAG: GH39 family glycosyl hydrolase [Bacillota bacterium]
MLFLSAMASSHATAADLHVDCSKVIGTIRPLHGSNCGPLQCGGLLDLSSYHRELALPYSRLHDCHWPNPDVVDLHVVFPNPSADPALPGSYDFSRTDEYLQAIDAVGTKIVYRLGESIEHTKKKYHVHPPADYDRWAAACLGIIRHYNEGFANGFHLNIRHWEIWNEPENRPNMWTGSDEDYFRLYEVTAKAIKAHDPTLKVGGPSLGYTGRITAGQFEPSPFFLAFLNYCKQKSLPLDFFSWHLYTADPSECMIRARGIRHVLDRHGFAKTELHFNEWNYLPGNDWTPMGSEGQGLPRERFYDQIGGAPGAAFSACVLMNLQDTPVDVANYYMADNQGFGMFSANGVPQKSFYALKAFRMLLNTPLRLETRGTQPADLALCAGTNPAKSEVGILVSNFKSSQDQFRLTLHNFPWTGPTRCEVYVVDATHELVKTQQNQLPPSEQTLPLDLKAPSLCFVKLSRLTNP